ncbi:hypothetical protein F4861DRAFT_499403 [Xylaria intraflava]|nr:hypothetical protein F4861DRAFT_499403 [Xylaria intraflava]
MSRSAMSSSGRNLTLTEELERLEQSITLTLQEIDHNFSKAHRIVTTSILPLVEQYGEHSNKVWEASKFWKQFFEASANVSLSGYEELAGEGDETAQAEEMTVDESTSEFNTTQADTTVEPSEYHDHQQPTNEAVEESVLEDVTVTGSTPRPPATKSLPAQFADFGSPYQALRRELKGDKVVFKSDLLAGEEGDEFSEEDDSTTQLPHHFTTTTRLPDMSMTQRSSSMLLDDTRQHQSAQKPKDLLLHRVLDKNYRLQATPLKTLAPQGHFRGRSPSKKGVDEEEPDEDKTRRALWAESPMSSPEMAVPKLRSDLYMPPAKTRRRSGAGGEPRTPGVSVQTPATAKKRDIFAEARNRELSKGKGKERDEITWDSDEDDNETESFFGGMSPPKTIQFALPASKLMQTPAREASRRIVDDILITAGEAPEEEEYSPTMVKVNHDILDDTF